MCFDSDDGPHVFAYEECVRIARKRHRCNVYCGHIIQCGELYVNTSGISEDGPFNDHYCGRCSLARQRIHEHELSVGCKWYQSWIAMEDIHEYLQETNQALPSFEEGQAWLAEKRKSEKEKPCLLK